MGQSAPDQVIQSLIKIIRGNLAEAHAVAKKASKSAKRGKPRRALELLMDFEGPALDAHDLFKAALNIQNHLSIRSDRRGFRRRTPFRE